MVTLPQIEAGVLRVLRQVVPAAALRELPFDQPLVSLGLTIDSLAMVQLITGLEKTFKVEFPEEIWTTQGQLRLADLVELIQRQQPETIKGPSVTAPLGAPVPTGSKVQQIRSAWQEDGFGGVGDVVYEALAQRFIHRVFRRDLRYILQLDLDTAPRNVTASVHVRCRRAVPEDRPRLAGLWRPNEQAHKEHLFGERQARNLIAVVAEHDGHILALDWLAPDGDLEPRTGLTIKTKPGTIYGFDLWEKDEFAGRGIGLALLDFSISLSRELGFQRQITIVHQHNPKMMTAATQMLGFRVVGSIRTTTLVGRPRSVSEIDGTRSTEKTLTL